MASNRRLSNAAILGLVLLGSASRAGMDSKVELLGAEYRGLQHAHAAAMGALSSLELQVAALVDRDAPAHFEARLTLGRSQLAAGHDEQAAVTLLDAVLAQRAGREPRPISTEGVGDDATPMHVKIKEGQ